MTTAPFTLSFDRFNVSTSAVLPDSVVNPPSVDSNSPLPAVTLTFNTSEPSVSLSRFAVEPALNADDRLSQPPSS